MVAEEKGRTEYVGRIIWDQVKTGVGVGLLEGHDEGLSMHLHTKEYS